MCGIAGLVSRNQNARLAEGALEALDHRGPDARQVRRKIGDWGAWELAFTRLSIIDLSPAGNQPMANEDGSLVMVFNGEIYNSPELRHYCETKGHRFSSSMDGEVILHLWEMEGPAALARLNGIFAVAVANSTTGEVVLARDPVGVKPLFYAAEGDTLWFASELNAIAAAGADLGPPDVVALAQFLTFLWIPDPRTPHSKVSSLEPGQALRWSRDGMELFRYWPLLMPEPEPLSLTPERAMAECEQRFIEAVHRQLLSDVPIGLMASGGIDSGLLWWAARDSLSNSFAVTWDTDDDPEGLREDAAAVATLERRFGTPTEYLAGETAPELLPPSGDLFADPAHNLARLIARRAHERGLKVLLCGQGGDELFAGYRRHAMAKMLSRLYLGGLGRMAAGVLSRSGSSSVRFEYVGRLARSSQEREPFGRYMQLCSYSSPGDRARILDCTVEEVADEVVWQRHREVFDQAPAHVSMLRKAMAIDLNVYLPGLGLAYMDRAGMEFGVEIRVPWLDLELLRWTLTLPEAVLIRQGRAKWLPKQLARSRLSDEVALRPKRGFAAPPSRVAETALFSSGGFRQAKYLARATELLHQFRERGREAVGAGGLS